MWSSQPHITHLLGKLVKSISYWSKFFFFSFDLSSSCICSAVKPLPYRGIKWWNQKYNIDVRIEILFTILKMLRHKGTILTVKDFKILQSCLWQGQCSFCSSFPTYPTHWQPPHIFKFPIFEDTGQIPNQYRFETACEMATVFVFPSGRDRTIRCDLVQAK